MKKILVAIVCWLSLLPGVSFANVDFDFDTFEATSTKYKITFSWEDGTFWGNSVDGLYGLLLTDADLWKKAQQNSWDWNTFRSAVNSTQGVIGPLNDGPNCDTGTFEWIVSGLTIGDKYWVGIGGLWYGKSGEVSVLSTTAVPEPETYAMFLAGLGLIGVIARRRHT